MKLLTFRPHNLSWQPWFAWRPVWVFEGNGAHLVWLQKLERRWNRREGVDESPGWEYAFIKR